jgi:hypothetical protein
LRVRLAQDETLAQIFRTTCSFTVQREGMV